MSLKRFCLLRRVQCEIVGPFKVDVELMDINQSKALSMSLTPSKSLAPFFVTNAGRFDKISLSSELLSNRVSRTISLQTYIVQRENKMGGVDPYLRFPDLDNQFSFGVSAKQPLKCLSSPIRISRARRRL
jgi:hypothetical protein